MKVGSLIEYFNPNLRLIKNVGLVGLVMGYEHYVEGRGMVQVLFTGFTLLRWVHEQDCEVIG